MFPSLWALIICVACSGVTTNHINAEQHHTTNQCSENTVDHFHDSAITIAQNMDMEHFLLCFIPKLLYDQSLYNN